MWRPGGKVWSPEITNRNVTNIALHKLKFWPISVKAADVQLLKLIGQHDW